MSWSVAITVRNPELHDKDFMTYPLRYVALLRRFDQHRLLAKFDYWLKETVFNRRLRLKPTNEAISAHVDADKSSPFVDVLFTMADGRDASMEALRPPEEGQEQEPGDDQDGIEEIWYLRDPRPGSDRDSSELGCTKYLYQSLLLLVATTVVKAQQRTEDSIPAFVNYPRLEAYIKTEDADLAATKEDWKQKTIAYEKEWTELK